MLICDTSILIDLERGGILTAAFNGSNPIAVPDVLYARELEPENGTELKSLGLLVEGVDANGVALAADYRRRESRLSVVDSFCLALASQTHNTLVTGDQVLRDLAEAEGVEVHGLLWFLDVLEAEGLLNAEELHSALTQVCGHPRCRLPRAEVEVRLSRYKHASENG